MTTQVLIIEDNKYMQEFFAAMFRADTRFAVAGSLRDAAQAAYFCQMNRVDLVLMDVQTLHGHSGLTAAEEIRSQSARTKIIVVTSLVDALVLEKARRVGVDSLWYKDHGEAELMDVVQRTLAGEHIFPDKEPNVEIGSAWSDELSDTQKNILRLYIRGNSYAAIGRKLFLEEATVKYHMNQMIQKCGLRPSRSWWLPLLRVPLSPPWATYKIKYRRNAICQTTGGVIFVQKTASRPKDYTFV